MQMPQEMRTVIVVREFIHCRQPVKQQAKSAGATFWYFVEKYPPWC